MKKLNEWIIDGYIIRQQPYDSTLCSFDILTNQRIHIDTIHPKNVHDMEQYINEFNANMSLEYILKQHPQGNLNWKCK